MIFPQLGHFTDLGLLLLRLMVGLVFFDSRRRSFLQPDERSRSIGMSKGFIRILGLAEMAGGLGVAFGVPTHSPRSA
jgi:putative oxidoreductase